MAFEWIRRINPLGVLVLALLGLAPRSALAEANGRVEALREDTAGITFTLAGSGRVFRYLTKHHNDMDRVDRTLRTVAERTVTVRYKPAGGNDLRAHRPVNELAFGGRMVRSYAQVRAPWDSDRVAARWGGDAFLLCALGLA